MIFSTDYQRPFWKGLFHAVIVVFYCLFVSMLYLSLVDMVRENVFALARLAFWLFFGLVSVAIVGYFIFFEPMKKILNNNFKAGAVMVASTLGWLFTFLIVFILGFALNM